MCANIIRNNVVLKKRNTRGQQYYDVVSYGRLRFPYCTPRGDLLHTKNRLRDNVEYTRIPNHNFRAMTYEMNCKTIDRYKHLHDTYVVHICTHTRFSIPHIIILLLFYYHLSIACSGGRFLVRLFRTDNICTCARAYTRLYEIVYLQLFKTSHPENF